MFAHCPPSQTVVKPGMGEQWLEHTFPHVPQLFMSMYGFTQELPQTMLGARHWHTHAPLTHAGVKPFWHSQM